MFSRKGEKLGCTTTVHHRIHTPDDIPVNQRYRRIPLSQFKEVTEHLRVLLERGVIRPRQSPQEAWSPSPVRGLPRLNAKTRKDAYPLPRIDESPDALGKAQYLSTIDLA